MRDREARRRIPSLLHSLFLPFVVLTTIFAASCTEADEECLLDKIAFDRSEGARFDAIEFCIPRGRTYDREILDIAPEVKLTPGSRGRIRCDPQRETLCLMEVRKALADDGRIAEVQWARICRLSRLDGIRKIRGTWFE